MNSSVGMNKGMASSSSACPFSKLPMLRNKSKLPSNMPLPKIKERKLANKKPPKVDRSTSKKNFLIEPLKAQRPNSRAKLLKENSSAASDFSHH